MAARRFGREAELAGQEIDDGKRARLAVLPVEAILFARAELGLGGMAVDPDPPVDLLRDLVGDFEQGRCHAGHLRLPARGQIGAARREQHLGGEHEPRRLFLRALAFGHLELVAPAFFGGNQGPGRRRGRNPVSNWRGPC